MIQTMLILTHTLLCHFQAQRMRQQAQIAESQARVSGPTANAAPSQMHRGEMPIDQVLQYINGEAPKSNGARKGKKKSAQKKRR